MMMDGYHPRQNTVSRGMYDGMLEGAWASINERLEEEHRSPADVWTTLGFVQLLIGNGYKIPNESLELALRCGRELLAIEGDDAKDWWDIFGEDKKDRARAQDRLGKLVGALDKIARMR